MFLDFPPTKEPFMRKEKKIIFLSVLLQLFPAMEIFV